MVRLALFLAASWACTRAAGTSLRRSLRFGGLEVDSVSGLEVDVHGEEQHTRSRSPMSLDLLLSEASAGRSQPQRQEPMTLDAMFKQAALKEEQEQAQQQQAPSPEAVKPTTLQDEPARAPLPASPQQAVLAVAPALPSAPPLADAAPTQAPPVTAAEAAPTQAPPAPASENWLPHTENQATLTILPVTPAADAEKPGNNPSSGATGVELAAGGESEANFMSQDQRDRLQLAKPITWFHVPKCGTTFANTLFHHTDICPKFSEKALISRVHAGIPGNMLKMILDTPGMYGVDIGKFTPDTLDELCDRNIDTRLQGLGHNGIGTHWSEVDGHSMIFLRQPEQRIISAYRHGRHGCLTCGHDTTVAEYAPLAAGCITRMLTREGDDACVNAKPPTLPEMALAIQRLRSGFVFVGITEQWDMSICLFHAKFGGKCHAYEKVNTRPGRYLSTDHPSYYDTEELGGFTDVFDRQLYMEAVAMFEEDVELYGLTRESCARMCGQ